MLVFVEVLLDRTSPNVFEETRTYAVMEEVKNSTLLHIPGT
jgi:hypothetical protein